MFYFNEYDYQYYLYSHHCIYLLICWIEGLAMLLIIDLVLNACQALC